MTLVLNHLLWAPEGVTSLWRSWDDHNFLMAKNSHKCQIAINGRNSKHNKKQASRNQSDLVQNGGNPVVLVPCSVRTGGVSQFCLSGPIPAETAKDSLAVGPPSSHPVQAFAFTTELNSVAPLGLKELGFRRTRVGVGVGFNVFSFCGGDPAVCHLSCGQRSVVVMGG